jgi:hypothetical protein
MNFCFSQAAGRNLPVDKACQGVNYGFFQGLLEAGDVIF